MEYGNKQTLDMMNNPRGNNSYRYAGYALANAIYFFVNKEEEGIMVYDYSDSDKLEVSSSFEKVSWREAINVPGQSSVEVLKEGTRECLTVMVSKEQMEEIITTLSLAQKDGKNKISIDLNEFMKKYNKDYKVENNEHNDYNKFVR